MAYVKQTWANLPSETSPLEASRFNHIEEGIYASSQTGDSNTSSINEIKTSIESLKDELFYKNGETWTVPDGYSIIAGGHITSAKKEIAFSIYTPKSMKNINSVTVKNAKITVRQSGNYLLDSQIVNLTLQKRTNNCLYVLYNSSSEISNAMNNDSVAIAFGNGTFTFSTTNVVSDEETSDLGTI